MPTSKSDTLPASEVGRFVADLFTAAGLSPSASERIAAALTEADLSGRASHGVLQADAYLARLMAGSMTTREEPELVSERGGAIVLDAADMPGQLAGEAAVMRGIEKAREYGVAAVAVRRGYHFGVAGRYVRIAAENGCVALAMCNTKAVMAAPGGAEKLVGTNPLAISIPVKDGPAIVLDMATTAGTVGKIRYAHSAGEDIPEGWATDKDGNPTTDAAAALQGILLPMGGPKGFGLSFVIDLIAGLLASGGWGPTLGEMRGDLSKPYNCAYFFIVIDVAHFRSLDGFLEEAQQGAERVRNSRKAAGTDRLYTPGERSALAIEESKGLMTITAATAKALAARAKSLGVVVPDFIEERASER